MDFGDVRRRRRQTPACHLRHMYREWLPTRVANPLVDRLMANDGIDSMTCDSVRLRRRMSTARNDVPHAAPIPASRQSSTASRGRRLTTPSMANGFVDVSVNARIPTHITLGGSSSCCNIPGLRRTIEKCDASSRFFHWSQSESVTIFATAHDIDTHTPPTRQCMLRIIGRLTILIHLSAVLIVATHTMAHHQDRCGGGATAGTGTCR